MAEFDHKSGKIPPKAEGLACMQLAITLQCGQFDPKFQVEGEVPHQ